MNMTIFTVNINSQEEDTEYSHMYMETRVLSYHQTFEGAEAHVNKLINKDIEIIDEISSMLSPEEKAQMIEAIKGNKKTFIIGDSCPQFRPGPRREEKHLIYYIRDLEVLP